PRARARYDAGDGTSPRASRATRTPDGAGGWPVPSAQTLRGDPVEIPEEAGIRDVRGLRAPHLDARARCEARHSGQHREPVVSGRVQCAAAQLPPALDRKAVRARFDVGAERRESRDDGRDAVRLLVAKLG